MMKDKERLRNCHRPKETTAKCNVRPGPDYETEKKWWEKRMQN